MSDTHGAEERDETEALDLTGVPMDGDDAAPGGEEGEAGEKKPAEGAAAAAKAALSPEEVAARYENTKTALAEERRERRALQRRLQALESGERAAAPARQQQQAAPEEEIDPDVDPIGALKQMRAKVQAYEKAEEQENRSAAERQAQERQFQAVEAQLAEHEADFRDDHPDYDEAAKHYAMARATELMNFGLPPQRVQSMLREEFAKLAQTAIGARKNPAAVVYEMAKGRGYGAKAADPKDPKAPAAKTGGKLDALAAGAKASSPLSSSGGRPTSGLDAVTVANINIRDPKGAEAFDKAWERMEAEAKRAERGR